ncbi:hypothetical protein ACHAXS_005357 [Conticribra weissflogii]
MNSCSKQTVGFRIYCLLSIAGPLFGRHILHPTLFASAFSLSRLVHASAETASSSRTSQIFRRPPTVSAMTSATASTAAASTAVASTLEEHSPSYKLLLDKLRTITHLERASAVLNYDRQVFMPQADDSAAQRGKQLAVLATISHEKATDPEIGSLLEKSAHDLEEWSSLLLEDGEESEAAKEAVKSARRLLELETKSYKKTTCLPSSIAARKAELQSSAYSSWVKARENDDFASFAPSLRQCFDLAKEIAALQRTDESISLYSQMLDEFEMGMEASRIDELFGQVQEALVPLLGKVKSSPHKPDLSPLFPAPKGDGGEGAFPIDSQKLLSRNLVTALGYDPTHGRIDTSVHPFTMSFSPMDVRITSRFTTSEWLQGLMGTIHEGGHAMYEQSLGGSDTSLDTALSMGVHESQSLFWERHIGKGKGFWKFAGGMARDAFSAENNAGEFKFDNLIRVDADELTYPLHVILRYNIERDVVEGTLKVEDIPRRWKDDMKSLLDVDVPNDTKGPLQDIHWSMMAIGYFPTYLLGAMMAAQLYHYCRVEIPDLEEKIERGEFAAVKAWLTRKVHLHGKRYGSLDDLLEGELGEKLNAEYFIRYLQDKYGELYQVA